MGAMLKNWHPRRSITFLRLNHLTTWIMIGLVSGLVIGAYIPELVPLVKPFQHVFLHGIKCVIAPLIFSTIVTGIASAGSYKQLGLMGVRAFIYFEVITTVALFVGLFMVNLFRPGQGIQLGGVSTEGLAGLATSKVTYDWFLEHLMPINFADAMVRGDVLQIVLFSTLFGFSVLAVGEKARPVLLFSEGLANIMFKFVHYIMYLAPIGVCSALATSISQHGLAVMIPLFKLVSTFYAAVLVFLLCVLYPVAKIYKIPLRAFLKVVKDPVLWAFATTSSESAYPMALERMEALGVPRRVASFVLPMGYSFNLDGSTLYLALASVFVAQAAGIELSTQTQLLMMLTLMLTTKGVAAVPRASMVILSSTVSAFGLPLEGVALIIGVDAFMDMGRSAVNLLGNCLATAVIARTEKIKLKTTVEIT